MAGMGNTLAGGALPGESTTSAAASRPGLAAGADFEVEISDDEEDDDDEDDDDGWGI